MSVNVVLINFVIWLILFGALWKVSVALPLSERVMKIVHLLCMTLLVLSILSVLGIISFSLPMINL